jgi:type II secretory ATPase GspE/PulE/Tfp pilus assembly ATPase PilB-like protein
MNGILRELLTMSGAQSVLVVKTEGKGYIGRTAMFEALVVDQETERAIALNKSPREIRSLMSERGEKTLFEQAVRLAAKQALSLEEALRLRSTGE